MSDTVIQVENLGKKYIIGHQQQEPYTALRDVIANKVKSLGTFIQNPKSKIQNSQEEFWALKDVSFEIKQGERVGIIGRNGAGKSTLLKILSRITEPTQGSIKIKGRVASLLEVGTGFHPELTGRENIYLNGAILGMSKAEIQRKFDEIVAFAEVEKFLDTPVKRYSSGMYVRLAFAVAAHLEPEILIVDEVLAVGDGAFQKKCLGKMEDVGKEGRTVLFVSHNMGAIKRLCSRAIHLQSGRLKGVDSTESIIQDYLSHSYSCVTLSDKQDKKIISDSDIDVLDFYSCDIKGNYRENFKTSEDVGFFIKYQLKNYLNNLRIGIDFYSYMSGEILFRAFDDDVDIQTRKPDIFEAICMVPSNLLKPGMYAASLQIGIHNVRWIVDNTVMRQVSIESVDGVNSNYSDSRPGIIMPKIEWNINTVI
ncbi:MAG: polysaccharide ABC transporter ATP-binding protein [Nostoc sp.]|uniref:ABC transporter ATP-binding protein n=1 Tax=Nostoc sp. TaxID=1180 RepID=UPI002FF24C78